PSGRTFYAPSPAPRLPSSLASSIVAISGLDSYSVEPQASPLLPSHLRAEQRSVAAGCTMMPGTLGAQTVAHAYGYDQLWAQGRRGEQMTIHLVEVDSFDGMDTQNYFNCVGFTGVLLSPTVVD